MEVAPPLPPAAPSSAKATDGQAFLFRIPPAKKSEWKRAAGAEGGNARYSARGAGFRVFQRNRSALCGGSNHHARGACDIIGFGNRCELGTVKTPK